MAHAAVGECVPEANAFFDALNGSDRKKLNAAAGALWAAALRAPVKETLPPSFAAGSVTSRPQALTKPVTVALGKTVLTNSEKWKLQAMMHREETKGAGGKTEYNKQMRPTKTTKGPGPASEAFPPGRGRPV